MKNSQTPAARSHKAAAEMGRTQLGESGAGEMERRIRRNAWAVPDSGVGNRIGANGRFHLRGPRGGRPGPGPVGRPRRIVRRVSGSSFSSSVLQPRSRSIVSAWPSASAELDGVSRAADWQFEE